VDAKYIRRYAVDAEYIRHYAVDAAFRPPHSGGHTVDAKYIRRYAVDAEYIRRYAVDAGISSAMRWIIAKHAACLHATHRQAAIFYLS